MSAMKTGLYQGVKLGQEMRINPRLYQAMDLLYMPLMDLQQHLKQELVGNPFLELVEPGEDPADEREAEEEEEIDWEEILLNGFDAGGRRQEYEEKEFYQPPVVATRDLYDHLRDQLALLRLEPRQYLIGEEIIGNVDDDGFLSCGLEEIIEPLNEFLETDDARELLWDLNENHGEPEEEEELPEPEPVTLEEVEEMLSVIQGFDPAGIAARDLRECLLLQLRDRGMTDTLS